MVSTADVKAGIVMVEAGVPVVVVNGVDLSNTTSIKLTEGVVSVMPRVVLSTDVAPSVVISAEVEC